MGYNKINQYKRYLIIVNIVKQHYQEGVTTYKGIWRTYVNPFYPISYSKFIEIMNAPNLERKLKEEEERVAASGEKNKYTDPDFVPKNQLDLFEKFKKDSHGI